MSDIQADDPQQSSPPGALSARGRILIAVAVFVVFAAIVGVRLLDGQSAPQPLDGVPGAPSGADPVAAFEDALAGNLPVVVFFHSGGGCPSCVEAAQELASVMPAYADRLALVDANTQDQQTVLLARRFPFQFVPTTVFITPDGEVFDQYSGILTAEEFGVRFDALIEASE